MDEHDALPAGTRFGELEIVRVLGIGGFGIVYLAQDHALERPVALKEYMPGSLAGRGHGQMVSIRSGAHVETYALGLRSFVNEARLLARFNHPSLVKVYRFWEENGTAYMVMPYLQGRTLRDVRRSMGEPPTEVWIRSVINPVLDALELLHREAVYHRDIAPDNILLPPGELPVLLDFGAARRAISDRTQTFTAILKPSYAPIEQYAEVVQLRQGPWTDLYALGAVVYYLLRGAPPPPATARAVQEDVVMLPQADHPDVSPVFLGAIEWALAIRPGDRPQNIAALREVLAGRASVPPRTRTGTTAPPSRDGAASTYQPTLRMGMPATEVMTLRMATERTRVVTAPPRTAPPLTSPGEFDADATVAISRLPAAEWPAAPLPGAGPAGAEPRSTSRRGWVLAGIAGLLVFVFFGSWMLGRSAAPVPAPPIAAASEPAAPALVQVVNSSVVAAPVAEAIEPVAAASSPVAAAVLNVPVDVPGSPPAAAARERSTPRERAAAAPDLPMRRDEPRAGDWTYPPRNEEPVNPRPVAPRKPVPATREAVAVPAAPAGPASPREACGGRVFIAMMRCMERQCGRPRFAGHAQCEQIGREIDNRRRGQDG